MRTFIKRNTLVVSAASAVFAATVIGAGVARWQARVALSEKTRAEQVKEFIASVFREADPTQGKGKVLSGAELLRQAELRLDDRTDVEPQIRVEPLAIIGESLFGLQETLTRRGSSGRHCSSTSPWVCRAMRSALDCIWFCPRCTNGRGTTMHGARSSGLLPF